MGVNGASLCEKGEGMSENKEQLTEKQAAFQLINIKGIGNQSFLKIVEHAGTAKKALELSESEIREFLNQKTANAFLRGREKLIEVPVAQYEKKYELKFVPYTSLEYPSKLKYISNPPACLYVKGALPAENKPAVAVIGARACSEYGKKVAEYFGRQLGNAGVQVISGMAKGIDGIAQRGAITGGGQTFGILGCGVDICYPPENRDLYDAIIKSGGLISEYPPGTEAQSALFPQRNRIISGLSDILLVIEARKRSGTYITVTQALEQGKEVFVVPGRITDALSEGCNFLLSQGAGVAISPAVIAEELKQQYRFRTLPDNSSGKKQCSKNADVRESEIHNSAGKVKKGGGESNVLSLREVILEELEITPISLEVLLDKIRIKRSVTVEELILELTKMQLTGTIVSMGNYYALANAL